MQLLLAVLAVYRLSHAVAYEDGPADAFTELRARVGQGHWIGRGLHCPLCISFWLAFVPALVLDHSLTLPLTGLGIGGAVLVLHLALYRTR